MSPLVVVDTADAGIGDAAGNNLRTSCDCAWSVPASQPRIENTSGEMRFHASCYVRENSAPTGLDFWHFL